MIARNVVDHMMNDGRDASGCPFCAGCDAIAQNPDSDSDDEQEIDYDRTDQCDNCGESCDECDLILHDEGPGWLCPECNADYVQCSDRNQSHHEDETRANERAET
eukprot:SAG31_NODE_693_length_12770_cov_64.934575_6_plen_105_part_00